MTDRGEAQTISPADLSCTDCGFVIPIYGRTAILAKTDFRTDEFTCSTCGAVYRVSVQRSRGATLSADKLAEKRNRNR